MSEVIGREGVGKQVNFQFFRLKAFYSSFKDGSIVFSNLGGKDISWKYLQIRVGG